MTLCASSEDFWRYCGCVLMLYLLPTICAIGIVLNVACLTVFIFHRNHPIVPALILLSICDSLQLFFSLFVLYIPALHEFSGSQFVSKIGQVAFISTGLFAPVLLTVNCASIWTMCYICIKRYRAISNPLSTVTKDSSSTKTLIIISIAAIIFNFRKWLEYRWLWIDLQHPPSNLFKSDPPILDRKWFLMYEYKSIINNSTYRLFWEHIIYPVCVYLIPLFLISILHALILTSLSKRKIQSIGHKRRMAKERRSLMLLISIVVLFFLCHTGGLVVRFFPYSNIETVSYFIFFKDIANFLFNVNSCANPMVYFVFTRHFKDLRSSWSNSKYGNTSHNVSVMLLLKQSIAKKSPDTNHQSDT